MVSGDKRSCTAVDEYCELILCNWRFCCTNIVDTQNKIYASVAFYLEPEYRTRPDI